MKNIIALFIIYLVCSHVSFAQFKIAKKYPEPSRMLILIKQDSIVMEQKTYTHYKWNRPNGDIAILITHDPTIEQPETDIILTQVEQQPQQTERLAGRVLVYPNPVTPSGLLNIEIINATVSVYSFRLYNSNGVLVYSDAGLKGNIPNTIQLNTLAKGSYHYKIDGDALAPKTGVIQVQ